MTYTSIQSTHNSLSSCQYNYVHFKIIWMVRCSTLAWDYKARNSRVLQSLVAVWRQVSIHQNYITSFIALNILRLLLSACQTYALCKSIWKIQKHLHLSVCHMETEWLGTYCIQPLLYFYCAKGCIHGCISLTGLSFYNPLSNTNSNCSQ